MSWRDRATPVTDSAQQPAAAPAASGWRARAQPVESEDAAKQAYMEAWKASPLWKVAQGANAVEGAIKGAASYAYNNPVEAAKSVGGFVKDVAVDIATNPTKTAASMAGATKGVKAGMALPIPAPLKPIAAAALGTVGGVSGAYAGQMAVDNPAKALIDAEGFGPKKFNLGQEVVANAFPLAGGAALRMAKGLIVKGAESAAGKAAAGKAEQAIIKANEASNMKIGGEPVNVIDAARQVYGKDADKLLFTAEATAQSIAPKGISSAKGLVNLASGPAKPQAVVANLEKRAALKDAYLKPAKAFEDVDGEVAKFIEKADKSKQALRSTQNYNEQAVFTPKQANTPILGATLKGALAADDIAAPMAAAGYSDKLQTILNSIPTGKPLTTQQLANTMSTISKQFVSKDDAQARAIFYDKAYPKIKAIMEEAAQGPTGQATKQYASAVNSYFDTRFGLKDISDPFIEGLRKNDVAGSLKMATETAEGLTAATKAFSQAGNKLGFQNFLQNLADKSSRNAAGQLDPVRLASTLGSMNPAVAKKALGEQYYKKMQNLMAVETATAQAGVEAGLRQAFAGKVGGKDLAEISSGILSSGAVSLATGGANSLQTGAMVARTGGYAIELLKGLAFNKSSYDKASLQGFLETAARDATSPESYAKYMLAARAAGAPVVNQQLFQRQVEQFQKSLEELNSSQQTSPTVPNGQGGPEATAPSMGPERNLDSMFNSKNDQIGQLIQNADAGTPKDALGSLITETTAQDDLTKLIRAQMMEDTPSIKAKLGTKNEEGFEPRVYRDTVGKKTVGIGFNMDAPGAKEIWAKAGIKESYDDVKAGKQLLTKASAESLYNTTAGIAKSGAAQLVKNFAELGQHQKTALEDMVFQLGKTGAMGFSKFRAAVEDGNFAEAARQLKNSKNYKDTPYRVLRRAYMLEHDVSLEKANADLIKSGAIPKKASIA